MSQVSGGFWDLTDKIIKTLGSVIDQEFLGLDMSMGPSIASLDANCLEIAIDDALASLFCNLCVLWLGARVRRSLHIIRGWPLRFAALHTDSRDAVVNQFKDTEGFKVVLASRVFCAVGLDFWGA